MTTVADVGDASTLLGLLLVLVTLFTSEQARRLEAEEARIGGPRRRALTSVIGLCLALAAVTVVALASLAPLAVSVARGCCSSGWKPMMTVFELVWALLIPLAVWQVILAKSALKIRPK